MNGNRKNIAFVVQRFGKNIVGGAESHCLSLVDKLSKTHDVTVYTTTSRDYQKWDSFYPEGETKVEGTTIKRFAPQRQRAAYLGILSRILFFSSKKFNLPDFLKGWLELFWIRSQGPYCPKLVADLEASREKFDDVYLMTYLYYPSLISALSIKGCIFIPTAHDEPPFYFMNVGNALRNCKKIYANTLSEKKLIEQTHQIHPKNIEVVGVGIDPIFPIEKPATKPFRTILYLGRISKGKGVDRLINLFKKIPNKSSYRLNLIGKLDDEEMTKELSDPHIHYLGFLSEKDKWQEITSASVIVCPSPLESLSMITLEGILAEKPILLNAECKIFKDYAKTFPSVFVYEDTQDFHKYLEILSSPEWSRENCPLLLKSKKLVENRYSWNRVLSFF